MVARMGKSMGMRANALDEGTDDDAAPLVV